MDIRSLLIGYKENEYIFYQDLLTREHITRDGKLYFTIQSKSYPLNQ